MNRCLYLLFITTFLCACAFADTFTHRTDGTVYHGYAELRKKAGKTVVHTVDDGIVNLNLAEYRTDRNTKGRNNSIAVLSILGEISVKMETDAFIEALIEESDKGPLFILIEIDTPGGRLDLAQEICEGITRIQNCETVAFIKGGKYGGAYSAGVAVSLACDKIYMAPQTIIGAASVVVSTGRGMAGIREIAGETVGEKMSSGWRNYLSSLAQKNNRPGLLAKAMVDREIEVVELSGNGKRLFVDPVNNSDKRKVLKTWSKKGSLLTLSASDAIECDFADKIAPSIDELLHDRNAETASIVKNTKTAEARKKYKKIKARVDTLHAKIDGGIKGVVAARSRAQAIKSLKKLMRDIKYMLLMKRKFGDDVEIEEEEIRSFLNTVEAEYDSLMNM